MLGPEWESFAPLPAAEIDRYWLGLAFPPGYNQFYSPSYQFGSTGGRYRPHHGVDISNPTGTPVLAMAGGEIIHAGPDNPTLLGPYNNFYGNSVVVRLDRTLSTPDGDKDVFLLYGHLNEVFVERGQRLNPGDSLGTVGMTGIAIGPHLHVEIRVGQNSYMTAVNPVLWMQ
ncbi:MAG: M23 family metallopeptidase [Caldilineaceae bacterium]